MRPVRVFIYGSLLAAPVLRAVVGRPPHPVAAVLPGYERRALRGPRFPGLLRRDGAATVGAVVRLSRRELQRLDRFEDDFYERRAVRVELADGRRVTAQAYVPARRERRLVARRGWSPARLSRPAATRLAGLAS